MNNNNIKVIVIAGSLILALMIVQSFWLMRYADKKTKTGYVLTQFVFEGFDGTKQLKFKLKNQENRQKRIIDSIALEYKLLASHNDSEGKEKAVKIKQLYSSLYKKFKEDNEEEAKTYSAEVWKQINQYINDYGKENNYSILYGADGNGNLMYADTSLNISASVLKYMNKRYAGQ
jgi:outer membrane protein